MSARFPWGAGPAPALGCTECGHKIGKRRSHYIFDGTLLCGRCAFPEDSTTVHAQRYPDCPFAWHDMYDHLDSMASRAAAWFVIKP